MADKTKCHIEEGPIERVQESHVGFLVLSDGRTVVPFYYGRKVYETWWEGDQKMGRWTWRYL